MTVRAITCDALERPGLRHAFFTRTGGVSEGLYASLNGGVGSKDSPEAVAENRRRMAEHLGVAPDRLLVPFQVHSHVAIAVDAPWAKDDRPRVDGLVTRSHGLALGVTGADCGMVLFADPQAGVIGACHSGWKGALNDMPGATIAAMVELGAAAPSIVAVLGPTIAQDSYEVGPEFLERFTDIDETLACLFKPSMRDGYHQFDLPGCIARRCRDAGVGTFVDLGLDTYTDEDRFYSYRRTTHRGEADYGRLVAAIVLD